MLKNRIFNFIKTLCKLFYMLSQIKQLFLVTHLYFPGEVPGKYVEKLIICAINVITINIYKYIDISLKFVK